MTRALAPVEVGHRAEAAADALECMIARKLGVPYHWVMVTNSCTAALTITYHFLAKDVAVECPVLTWPSSYACAPLYRLVDTEWIWRAEPSWSTEACPRTYVELYGVPGHDDLFPQDDDPFPKNTTVRIIDAAQNFLGKSHAWMVKEGKADAICYSMGPIKQVSAMRGGVLISPHITSRWRAFRDSGTLGRDAIYHCGFNLEISEQAAVLAQSQLKRHDARQQHRKAILGIYEKRLCMLTDAEASGHLAVMQVSSDTEVRRVRTVLAKENIATGHHYPLPIHCSTVEFPIARQLSASVITLPCHTNMTLGDAEFVCDAINEVL